MSIMSTIVATCHKLVEAEVLRRSSQVVSVIENQAYIFGGELRPREPRDNDIHVVFLGSSKSPSRHGRQTSSNGRKKHD
jgi:hypothetical protein